MAAVTACRTCGTGLRENAKFCDECGAPVTAPDSRAEYKLVTVLFAEWCARWTSPRRWVRSGCGRS